MHSDSFDCLQFLSNADHLQHSGIGVPSYLFPEQTRISYTIGLRTGIAIPGPAQAVIFKRTRLEQTEQELKCQSPPANLPKLILTRIFTEDDQHCKIKYHNTADKNRFFSKKKCMSLWRMNRYCKLVKLSAEVNFLDNNLQLIWANYHRLPLKDIYWSVHPCHHHQLAHLSS